MCSGRQTRSLMCSDVERVTLGSLKCNRERVCCSWLMPPPTANHSEFFVRRQPVLICKSDKCKCLQSKTAPVLTLAVTVLAFNAACLQSIPACSLYLRLTERPSNAGLLDVSSWKHLTDLIAIQVW